MICTNKTTKSHLLRCEALLNFPEKLKIIKNLSFHKKKNLILVLGVSLDLYFYSLQLTICTNPFFLKLYIFFFIYTASTSVLSNSENRQSLRLLELCNTKPEPTCS
jgi:hypothetical protein